MKKTKIKMLTTAACLALIGSASAAWVYSGTATASANIGVKVAAYASAGEITVTGADNLNVYIDKGSITFKQKDESKDLIATYSKPSGFTDSDKEVTFTYTVSISEALANYVTFATGVNSTTDSNSNLVTSDTYEWTSGEAINNLPGLAYKDSNKSDELATEDNYKEFVAELTGNSTSDDTWFSQTKEWTASEKSYYVTINFSAKVAD